MTNRAARTSAFPLKIFLSPPVFLSNTIAYIDMSLFLARGNAVRTTAASPSRAPLVCKALYRTFQPGDIVLARHVLRPDRPLLSAPLAPGKEWALGNATVRHDDIIGQPVRTPVVPMTKKGTAAGQTYILTQPSLDEYVVHRKRQAQPIYPLDAAAIVALADIHEDETGAAGYGRATGTAADLAAATTLDGTEREARDLVVPIRMRQYLEAGTGHGSLTLAIARAIHAANGQARQTGDLSLRGAVLHTIDRNASHSKTGRLNVRDFRNGMYYGDVEFHVADSPEQWLIEHEAAWRARGLDAADLAAENDDGPESPQAFLSGAFLDLPAPDSSVAALTRRLVVDAPLIVFCPSVSQIQDIVERIRADESIDLTLTNTVELMPGIAGGSMRAWDVRSTTVRQTGEVARVCRPRVGAGVAGGGFVAVFRKLSHAARINLRILREAQAAEAAATAQETSPVDQQGETEAESDAASSTQPIEAL